MATKALPKRKTPHKKNRAVNRTLSESTKLLGLAEELAHFGCWQWDVAKPRAVWSNEMFRIFGIEPNVEGLTLEEYQSFVHPDDLPELNKGISASFIKANLNQKAEFDYRIIRRDGSIRVIHSKRQIKEITKDGKVKLIVGVDQDVTDQRYSEESTKKSEERFRIVAEAANVMAYEINFSTGKIHILNGCEKLLGYKSQEVELRWAADIIHPDDQSRVLTNIKSVINDPSKEKYVIEYRVRNKNGDYLIVKDTAKAIRGPQGKTLLFIGGIRDITQRRNDQEKIQQYSKHLEYLVEERTKQLVAYERLAAIGQIAGMVGHDIRNPLQSLSGEAYLIKTEISNMPQNETKESIAESLSSIEEGITYINKIVADLQDYSRKLIPEYSKINLTNLLTDVLTNFKIPKEINLSFNFKPTINLTADSTFLKRALTNLINNAIQAMPNGGKLEVSAFQEGNNISISVADTCVGIPEELKAKLFTPLFTTKSKGQGLGLAVVKRLIEAQDGSVSFESKSNCGTKFLITLPIKHKTMNIV